MKSRKNRITTKLIIPDDVGETNICDVSIGTEDNELATPVERQIEKENSETQKIPEDETTPKFNSQAGLSSSTIVFETNKTPEDKTPPISKDSQAGPSSSTIVSETHETPEDKAPPISNSQAGPSSSTILSEVSPNTFNKSLEEICTLPKNSEVSGNTKKRHQL
ncbi:hypothetical protein JTB14_016845 [Gonioctena quinquepunctata]|nr:hypothetical protein JTB14_016845 [Gonioctena quinquepunctata]